MAEGGNGRFEALCIDFYGTITAGDRAVVERTCAKVVESFNLPMTPEELAIKWGECFFSHVDESNHDRFRTLYECECQSLRETIGPLVGPFDPAPLVAELEAYWHDPPVHEDALDLLAGLNMPICCVSNADTAHLQAAIEKHKLRFDFVVSSEEARCYKPDPAIFQRALQAMKVDASRVLHVGDSLHSDVGGARAAGLATAWLCRDERIHDIGTGSSEFDIVSLNAIPGILGL